MKQKQPEISRYSYRTEGEAIEVARWLAEKCEYECGGTWHAYWHENLGWFPSARLGDPFVAVMDIYNYDSGLVYSGGFVATPGKASWLGGHSFSGRSPLEVLLNSERAIVEDAVECMQRLARINDQDLRI